MPNFSILNAAPINGSSSSGPFFDTISDIISANDTNLYPVVFRSSLTDNLRINSTLIITYLDSILESLSTVDSSTPVTVRIGIINESIRVQRLIQTNILFKELALDTFSLQSNSLYGYLFEINEQLSLIDSALLSLKANDLLEDYVSLSYQLEGIKSTFESLNDLLTLSDNILSSSFYYNSITDLITIVMAKPGSDSYLAYLLAPESMNVTNYSNYNFDLSCRFDDKYLFANSIGLYEYGGNRDDGEPITAEFTTPAHSFSTSNLKQMPYFYLGVTSSSTLILKVRVDGKGEIIYKLNKHTNNLMTQKVDIGKGLIGRYFQFEIITDADDFDLESIEFCPLVIRRKL